MKKVKTILSLVLISIPVFATDKGIDNLVSSYRNLMVEQTKYCTRIAADYASAKAINEIINIYSTGRAKTEQEINVIKKQTNLLNSMQQSYENCLKGEVVEK